MKYSFLGALIFSFSAHAFVGYAWITSQGTGTMKLASPIQVSYIPSGNKTQPIQVPPTAQPLKLKPLDIPSRSVTDSLPKPKTAVDFMADPRKVKAFNDYFGKLKDNIQIQIHRKYSSLDHSPGTVSLYFVLNPDGSLVKVAAIEAESEGDAGLRKIAMDSVRRAAPFRGFPRELGNGPVAFNLKVYFDEME